MLFTSLTGILVLLLGVTAERGSEAHARNARSSVRRDGVQNGSFPIKYVDATPKTDHRVLNEGFDIAYSIQINAGSPAQKVRLQIDPGKNEIWLGGQYNANNSKTKTNPTPPAGIEQNPRLVPPYSNYVADQISVGNETLYMTFWGGKIDNTMIPWFGMACTKTSFWGIASAKWADKQIGLFLSRHRDSVGLPTSLSSSDPDSRMYEDSELVVGGLNRSKITGNMTYYPFTPDDRGTWTVPLQGISVNGKLISTSGGGSNTNHSTNVSASATTSASKNAGVNAAVFHSTRTRGIVVPPRVAPQILESIPGAVFDDHYRLPTIQCDNLRNLDVRLIIGGDEYLMNSRDLLLYQTNSSKCIIDISSSSGSNDSTNDYSIGTSFLKNVYTAFRFDPPAVGFAQLSPQARYKSDPVGWASPLTGQYMFVWVAGIASIAIMFVVSA